MDFFFWSPCYLLYSQSVHSDFAREPNSSCLHQLYQNTQLNSDEAHMRSECAAAFRSLDSECLVRHATISEKWNSRPLTVIFLSPGSISTPIASHQMKAGAGPPIITGPPIVTDKPR